MNGERCRGGNWRSGLSMQAKLPIPGEAARYSGMMPPTHSEMMSPTVPR
jgi:hypothetical protein